MLLILFLFPLCLIIGSCGSSRQVEKLLMSLHYEYEIDPEGDYRAEVPLPDGRKAFVGLSAGITRDESMVGFREIWSVAGRLPTPLRDDVAQNLLLDNWTSRHLGAWANAGVTSDGEAVLVYVVRIPTTSSRNVYRSVMERTAHKALGLQAALAVVEDEDGFDKR